MIKKRKSLDDSLAEEFVFGTAPEPAEPELEKPIDRPQAEAVTPQPLQQKRKPTTKQKSSVMSQLLETTSEKEATVRLTVDLPESMHRKLSLLSARSGKKKAEIVRMLLDEALQEVED
jgi:hypothetical protein